MVITAKDAAAWRWLSGLDQHFPIDREFRFLSGELLEALRNGDFAPFLQGPALPYEEWLAIVACGFTISPSSTLELLQVIARTHCDDGWRFHAVRILADAGSITLSDIVEIARYKTDRDNLELLCDLRDELTA